MKNLKVIINIYNAYFIIIKMSYLLTKLIYISEVVAFTDCKWLICNFIYTENTFLEWCNF